MKSEPRRMIGAKRKALDVTGDDLVSASRVLEGSLPLLLQAKVEGVDATNWIASHRDFLREQLLVHGGVLLRDFDLRDVAAFETAMHALSGDLLEYRERSSPRSRVEGRIYTSTDYPADQTIFLHNENSYQRVFPLKIAFFCAIQPTHGGETPIADVRRVYQRLPAEIRDKFVSKQVMYVRNFSAGVGLSWQTVFQTEDRAEVERYCQSAGIQTEWRGEGLRTRQIRPAVAHHPVSGAAVWFNHATFFHLSTLPPAIAAELLAEFGPENLPNNSYYGDGSPIEPPVLDELRTIYESETVRFRWHKGDMLILENMLVAHGRAPFEGERKIVVGMAEPHQFL